MQSSEFEQYFQNFRSIANHFEGIFSLDTFPKVLKKRHFLICNTSKSNERGQHWFCIVKVNHNHIELFDSLGVTPEKLTTFIENINVRAKYLTYNESQFQDNQSILCGKFCIYFLFHRVHNFDQSFDDILEEIFSSNFYENEISVSQFCDKLLTN